jgi:dihydrofolate reductase
MSKVIAGARISLDGLMNDSSGSVSRLYPDMLQVRESEVIQESIRMTGAVLMGRHAYDMANGDFTDYEYQVPIFVLTHHVPETTAKGENGNFRFHFVTDGIESAMQQAKVAAGDKNVTVIGGADTFQQCIRHGLIDELQLDIVPVLLCNGLRFFESIGVEPIALEKISVRESAEITHLHFRFVK